MPKRWCTLDRLDRVQVTTGQQSWTHDDGQNHIEQDLESEPRPPEPKQPQVEEEERQQGPGVEGHLEKCGWVTKPRQAHQMAKPSSPCTIEGAVKGVISTPRLLNSLDAGS
jgi:hypothetical protein